jgi:ubiquinone/menaquinone biosynthesis C-methylase UbiE
MLDVGCASGAFLSHAIDQLSITECVGVDISENLLVHGKEYVPDVTFRLGSIENLDSVVSEQFDVCTCLGTLGIFGEIEPHVRSLLRSVKPGGMLLIFDAFNENPIDVQMMYRNSADRETDGAWQSALNTFSVATYERILSKLNDGGERMWIDFDMPFPIAQTKNPMYAWTLNTEVKQNQVVVGTGQLLDQKILVVTKAK